MIKKLQLINVSDIELINRQSYIVYMENGFQPRTDLPPYKLETPLDWNINPFNDNNWTFQLHSWRNLDPAIIDYKSNKSETTLHFIIDVIKSWFHYSKENKHDFLWYDMAVGLRAQKIGLLANELIDLVEVDSNNEKWIYPLILSHLDNLMANFSLNNHGIFQAHGLMVLAKAFDFSSLRSNNTVLNTALERMSQLWSNQFYPEGIHSENSPEYHVFAQRKFVKLAATNWYHSIRLDEALISAKRNFFWLCRPNKQIWPIGDSGTSIINIPKDIADRELLLSPEHNGTNFKFFEQSGYFISKSKDAKFGFFISTARKNKVHMHQDDLNFEWFDFGRPIIVDSGKYGYTGCKNRKYYKSPNAHNIILINGKPIHGDIYDSCLRNIIKKEYGLLIELQHKSIDKAVNSKRLITTRKNDFLIIIDYIEAMSSSIIEQQFNLHPNFCTHEENKELLEHNFIDSKDNFSIRVKTISDNDIDNTISYGDTIGEHSFVSEKYRQQQPSYLIKSLAKSNRITFATLFTISNVNIEISNNSILINKDNILIDTIDIKNHENEHE